MVTEVDNNDLRILSLLHALGDREEFIFETVRLLMLPGTDEAAWHRIRVMGLDISPDHGLFDSGKTLQQLQQEFGEYPTDSGRRILFDRRKGERRTAQRREGSDRRQDQRRATPLPWLGDERRSTDRRQCRRRREDLHDFG